MYSRVASGVDPSVVGKAILQTVLLFSRFSDKNHRHADIYNTYRTYSKLPFKNRAVTF